MSQDSGSGAKDQDKKDLESRRNFLKTAVGAGAVLAVGGIAAVTKSLWTPSATTSGSFPRVKVANAASLQTDAYVIFNYPLDDEPNMLVKLGQRATGGVGPEGDVVAFSVVCQHLGCVVGYGAQASGAPGPAGVCPCHGSVYDFVNGGRVISGPAPRPQPQVSLEFDEATGDIYAVGMGPPTVFGHNTGSNDVSSDLQGGTLVT
jgi:arsenite oxidase small subunit